MAKFFFAVFLAGMVAVSSAQSESTQRFRDMQCQLEVQQIPLDACRQLLDRQLSGLRVVVPSWMRPWQPRAQCCQQLKDVSPECRCSAIRHMVRSYEQSLPPLEGGCGGERGGQQQGGDFGGERCQQQGGYCGETGQQLAGGCCSKREEWQPKLPPRTRTGQQTTREKLARLRQYARELPAMCRIEPQECSIFAACQY
ncbi:hypothetical protein PR202_ga05564 [Eleusine coracana subsp. coracana]|uniref:Bifunctional inhibitor/plant lipid transfer protein/seed storage helical domain-containing protein n=1 Tax=Eleusine coracana subsp. coracana TaxID=191504 RepID=A0AAV5BT65_ELECO|nr:hypothetical protein QOZ80_5AG0367890 [Eleusine coracana subsp. coracana]GJM88975.1 hypothetical protein PR202_ga05111 [Eleusine coracana subsp. coracana]GJM89376.1 hypothetical protein PR202_ga05564 [Eleusine coracana subsp. coracana]